MCSRPPSPPTAIPALRPGADPGLSPPGPRPRTARSAVEAAAAHAGSGSILRPARAHPPAASNEVSSPAAIRARKAAPRAAPSGTATVSTGSPVASATACIHGTDRDPPPVAMIRRPLNPERSRMRRITKPLASWAPRTRAVGALGDVEAVHAGPQRRVVEGGPLAPQVGKPHRHPRRVARPAVGRRIGADGRGAGARPWPGPSRRTGRRRCSGRRSSPDRPPCWAWCVRPGTSFHSSVTTHTMRVAPKMARTSPGWLAPATICSQKASIEPPAKAVDVPGTEPDGRSHLAHHRELALVHPELVQGRLVPPLPAVQAAERGGRGRSPRPGPRSGRGWPPPGSSSSRRHPGVGPRPSRACASPARVPRPGRRIGRRPGVPGPAVAVEEAGEQGPAPPVHGGDRGDHRGDDHAGGRRRRARRTPRRRPAAVRGARPGPRRARGSRPSGCPPDGEPGPGPAPCPRRPRPPP